MCIIKPNNVLKIDHKTGVTNEWNNLQTELWHKFFRNDKCFCVQPCNAVNSNMVLSWKRRFSKCVFKRANSRCPTKWHDQTPNISLCHATGCKMISTTPLNLNALTIEMFQWLKLIKDDLYFLDFSLFSSWSLFFFNHLVQVYWLKDLDRWVEGNKAFLQSGGIVRPRLLSLDWGTLCLQIAHTSFQWQILPFNLGIVTTCIVWCALINSRSELIR